MNKIKIFVDLTRLNKPIGYMLLFWPCSWGLTFGYSSSISLQTYFFFLFLFLCGSILMRSAGCIFNDIVDKDLDLKVSRTKSRPIPAKKISVVESFFYVCLLCSFAFFILIQFNTLTIFLGLASMLLAFSYPFMKRITYWPQLFLGITFNWGAVMAWAAINNDISAEIMILYFGAIFWTLGYDTIYGAQDMIDDEIIGIKSTAIKFKSNIKVFVSICYAITSLCFIYIFFEKLSLDLFTFFFCFFMGSLLLQLKIINFKNPKSCLKTFRLNNFSGFLLFISLTFYSNLLNI